MIVRGRVGRVRLRSGEGAARCPATLEPRRLQPPGVGQRQVLSTSAAPASPWRRSLSEPDAGRVGLGSEITTGGISRAGLQALILPSLSRLPTLACVPVPFGISAFWFQSRGRFPPSCIRVMCVSK